MFGSIASPTGTLKTPPGSPDMVGAIIETLDVHKSVEE